MGCQNTSLNYPKTFFSMPKTDSVRAKWLQCCPDSISKYSKSTLCNNYHICSAHFSLDNFVRKLSPFKNKLHIGSVPIPPVEFYGKFIIQYLKISNSIELFSTQYIC